MDLVAATLDELTAWARARREIAGRGVVTYSPKVFVPLTKLCRDVCHYCTFAQPPRRGERAYLTIDEVLEIARAGEAAGCREALFTLGDKPELRYRAARDELAELGFASTIEYLAAAARAVLEQTTLLPHVNPGVLTRSDLELLRGVSASMGLMLETTSERLSRRGGPHFGSPDKLPAARLETLRLAGEAHVPFTTGILIGIGETRRERLHALGAIAAVAGRFGHVQEVIVQNFRAKPGTKMANAAEPALEELLWTIAAARILLPPEVAVQAPPNLSDDFGRLLDAGIDDFGGVSPVTIDHVNPEAPWPEVEALRAACAARGLELAPRLTVYPPFVSPEWVDERVLPGVLRAADSLGLAREDRWAAGETGGVPFVAPRDPLPVGSRDELGEDEVVRLFRARGEERSRVLGAADAVRREMNGDVVSYVVTRNVQYTNVCYFRCGFCAFSKGKLAANLRGEPYLVPHDEIVRRAREAWERGATEICLQGGIHPAFDGDYYASVVRAIKDAVPELHVHAFSALEVWQGAATLGVPLADYLARLRDEGLASLPGTAAEVLDDEIRAVICPDKISTAQWLEVHRTAHRAGLRSNNTIMFGHVDGPRNWARHLLAVRELQRETRGFTEFVPLPFVHMEAPLYLKGRARSGPTFGELLLMHAVGRLALHPWIENVQVSWVKAGPAGVVEALHAGVNDLGGTLMNESISRAAGAGWGQELPPERMEALIRSAGRVPRQRTTLYGEAPPEQVRRSFGAPPLAETSNPHVNEARLERPRRLVRPLVSPGV
jgi:FO synthase